MKQHAGHITVESEVDRGSVFTVTVPFGGGGADLDARERDPALATPHAHSYAEEALRWLPDTLSDELAAVREAAGSGPGAAGEIVARSRILLADDNADLRGYIGRLLAGRGYEVEAVSDGVEALAALKASRPDLLVTDVMMPRLDGYGLLRAVRQDPALQDLSVVMLSARAGEDEKVEGFEAGADDYLVKPFSARELLARVAANIAMARVRREAAVAIHASEAREREQAERLEIAVDAGAIVGTWVWETRTDRFTADERFARTFGVDAELCRQGVPLSVVMASIHDEDRPRVEEAVAEALARGGPYRCEYRVLDQAGVLRWIEANGRVDLGPDGVPDRFPGVLVYVEHRHAVEAGLHRINEELESRVTRAVAQREEAEEALRQAQKMEAVGHLTGGIAHDFNNLLTIIGGNIDIARRALAAAEMARANRAMDSAQKGAERATALTQRLLAFSRRQPLAPKSINVDRLVAGMADLLHRALGETVRLETVSTPGLWRVEADPNQLESALLNLVVNARDAMPEGGNLIIETGNARLDRQYAEAHAEVAPGNYVVMAVTDTGHGMSRETLARVFDPFFTTKEVGKGTGLGLSMVYGFVKQSGGHVKIYSEPGDGTTVKIYLPRLMSGAAEEEEREQLVDRAGAEQIILVVEDDDDVRSYTVEILREIGYRVLEAGDGPAALRILQRQQQKIDLLLTDVVMPKMSGRELVDRAREHRQDLKVLYTSGYTRNAIVHGGRLDAGIEMIAKPFTYQDLAEKVADMLDTGRSGRILVVEPDETARMVAREALASAGFAADEAATAAEAMGRVRAAQGRYDAVLVDARLPESERAGEALVTELRATHKDLPILLSCGGETEEEIRRRFAQDRRTLIIGKPFDAGRLLTALAGFGVRRE